MSVITIDGPSASGKSSVGYLFSREIGYAFVDSGSIYRAGCIKILKKGIPLDSSDKHCEIFRDLLIEFDNTGERQTILLDGFDVTEVLHEPGITSIVPIVGANLTVRSEVRSIQSKLARRGNVIMTGRDIGSEIFPNAKLKFFLTASAEIRALRRYQQVVADTPNAPKYEDILTEIQQRDIQDSRREASPMRVPEDAIIIDTTKIEFNEVVGRLSFEFYKSELYLNNA